MMVSPKKYDGVLLVDKPAGITSHDVVNRVRRILNQRDVGHTGTLDPLATGLMVVCVGKGTKIAQFLTAETKSYLADVRLGMSSTTYDAEGVEAGAESIVDQDYSEAEVQQVLEGFRGVSIQRVPPHSAVHVNGQRLYELTRQGKTVELPERQIEVLDLKLLEYASPHVKFAVTCSSGTYIRSIANDIGERLGCGAYLAELRRTAVGAFQIEQAVTLDTLQQVADADAIETILLPITEALQFASITLNAVASQMIGYGRAPEWRDVSAIDGVFERGAKLLAKDSAGKPLAIVIAGSKSTDFASGAGHPIESFVRVFA